MRHRVGAGVFPWQRLGMQRTRRGTGNSSTEGACHHWWFARGAVGGPVWGVAFGRHCDTSNAGGGSGLHGLSREGSGRVALCGELESNIVPTEVPVQVVGAAVRTLAEVWPHP